METLALTLSILKEKYPGGLDIEEVAKEIRSSSSSIYRCIDAGTFPPPLRPSGPGRGRKAFWPIAIIAAYLSGTWMPTGTPTAPKVSVSSTTQKKCGRPIGSHDSAPRKRRGAS